MKDNSNIENGGTRRGSGSIRVRLGSAKPQQSAKKEARYLSKIKTLCNKFGHTVSSASRSTAKPTRGFGVGRAGLETATNSQRVTVKSRVVKNAKGAKNLNEHIRYIARDGVEKDGSKAKAFNEKNNDLTRDELREFARNCSDDRHTFRLIISPELADRLDLKEYTRELVGQMEKDLGTKLDWVAVNHHNTDNPHTHLLLRGKTDRGADLVLKRDYIGNGIRCRAAEVATRSLGQRTEQDIIRQTMKEIAKERFTQLDRNIIELCKDSGMADLTKTPYNNIAKFRRNAMLQRFKVLNNMGLAHEVSPGQWRVNSQAENILRDMGQRGDIIKTMHNKMKGVSKMPECVIYKKDITTMPEITGVVVHKGLADELKDDKFSIIQATDGKAYYVPMAKNSERENQESEIGSVVSVRQKEGGFIAVETLSRQRIDAQIRTVGPTWLDKELSQKGIAGGDEKIRTPLQKEIETAMRERLSVLKERGLATTNNKGEIKLKNDVFHQLEKAEFAQVGAQYKQEFTETKLKINETFAGKVDRVAHLSDGTYVVIVNDRTKQFTIVPYRPGMEQAQEKNKEISITLMRERVGFAPARVELKGLDPKKKITRGKELQ